MNQSPTQPKEPHPAETELQSFEKSVRPSIDLGKRTDGQIVTRKYLDFIKPSDCVNFDPPEDFILAGDCHLVRGGLTVLGGAPGVGKSRAALALAVAGATGADWLGHPIHSQFKTLVIQCENGMFRLKQELSDIGGSLDDWIRITPPPIYGLAFNEAAFRLEVQKAIATWKPGLIVIDPWNRVAQGDKQADYREALEGIFECLPEDESERPAVLVVHHLRKKSSDATHKRGRDLLHELAGSYQIGSSARCVFALEAASTDVSDDRVVLTCCKNNDGREGEPSAWHRCNGLFAPCDEFDWEAFYGGEDDSGRISERKIREALEGVQGIRKTEAVKRLIDSGACKRSAGYALLAREHANIEEDDKGLIYWRE